MEEAKYSAESLALMPLVVRRAREFEKEDDKISLINQIPATAALLGVVWGSIRWSIRARESAM